MIKRLQAIGNSSGLIIDRPILDLLNITVRAKSRKTRVAEAQANTLAKHADTFRKLSK